MSVQSEIDRIITAVGNAYSKVSEKGGTVPASQTVANLATAIGSIPSGGAKETWVIKSDAAGEFATTQIAFTSNGQKFTSIGTNSDYGPIVLYYDNTEIAGYEPGTGVWYEFDNDAYRKLTFDTSPTGALLTWLQSNAVKQPDGTAVQDTKALTITSNGTVSVTPDAPYDGMSSVDVTVNVSGGGGGAEPATLTITSQSYTGNRHGTFIFVNSEGHLEQLFYTSMPFTFPITFETVLGGTVAFVPDRFLGLPAFRNPIGCEASKYMQVFYFLVTSSQASVEIYDND